jgi:2-hydroxychromene-2-carboxylate isomerase
MRHHVHHPYSVQYVQTAKTDTHPQLHPHLPRRHHASLRQHATDQSKESVLFHPSLHSACLTTSLSDKNEYISADRTRLATLLNIPIIPKIPSFFPPNTLRAQRALCTIQNHHPTNIVAAFEALYQAFWVEGLNISEPAIVAKALASVFGEEMANEIVAGTAQAEVKQLLNGNTDSALGVGVFGVPFWVARDGEGREEVFFGVDRVGMVGEFLGLGRGEKGEGGVRALL